MKLAAPGKFPSCNQVSIGLGWGTVSRTVPNSAANAQRITAPAIRPLTEVRVGTRFFIKRLSASAEVNQRLREMGCGEEREAKLLSRHANVICQIRQTRLGLSPQVARAIWVEPLPHLAPVPGPVSKPKRLLARALTSLIPLSWTSFFTT
jgi:Fe2+ transport system protein FeoA